MNQTSNKAQHAINVAIEVAWAFGGFHNKPVMNNIAVNDRSNEGTITGDDTSNKGIC